ncbi:hypothetical protein M622_16535 [Thauera terpenica 58Eu]|jgi:antitoxin CcdA|uniref:Uncharacterized protein n=1 Tax=Thauera terpenica 58Eu TaxID=1348657 RepID=S9ZKQ8_9RHOO|nr:hypothetical protein M622_16535 [Thauera terpenica 58Eu]
MMHTTACGAACKPTNVTLDEALIAEAKTLHIDISQATEAGLAPAVAESRVA